jgi:hypothetical protein
MNRAIELSGVKPINGFPRVADKLASDPDKTTSIFRRFDRLSSRNLLFLEAELAELEALQNKYDEDDLIAADRMVIDCHSDWRKFERYGTERDEHGNPRNPGQAARLELAVKIKEKIKEYRMSILKDPTRKWNE